MKRMPQSVVASMVLGCSPAPNLESLAQRLMQLFSKADFQRRGVIYDCDDVAFIDLDDIRVALSIGSHSEELPSNLITLGVGQRPHGAAAKQKIYDKLAEQLVRTVSQLVEAHSVLWSHRDGPICTELLDDVLEETIEMYRYIELKVIETTDDPQADLSPIDEIEPHRTLSKPLSRQPAPQKQLSPLEQEERMAQFRQYLINEKVEPEVTTPMQAAVFAMSSTLMFLAPPVGAALFTYCILRSSDEIDLPNTMRLPSNPWENRALQL